MNVPKFQERGKTVKRKPLSVLLHPGLAVLVEKAAKSAHLSKSDWIAALLARNLKWTPNKKEKR